jgi:hypothetical protein
MCLPPTSIPNERGRKCYFHLLNLKLSDLYLIINYLPKKSISQLDPKRSKSYLTTIPKVQKVLSANFF